MYDVVIIGAGIEGCFIAHQLSGYQLSTAVFDQESDVANEASMANSAIIHAGEDPEDGTLKAKMNVRGNRMYEQIAKELSFAYQKTSAYIAAVGPEEEQTLLTLKKRAESREIPAELLDGDSARRFEPNLSAGVTKVLELPTTGIIYPWEAAIALAEESSLNGTDFFLSEEVTGVRRIAGGYKVTSSRRTVQTKLVVDAAGAYADRIAAMAGSQMDYSIHPRRGQYYVLDRLAEPLVSRVIYPVPTALGKGVLVLPTVHGNILVGPNSEVLEDPTNNETTAEGLAYVKKQASKTVSNIPFNQVIRTFSGLRPSGSTHDFVICEDPLLTGFIHVSCIESPGIASAPAIGEYVAEELILPKLSPKRREQYVHRIPIPELKKLPVAERNRMIQENPAYGRMICRCEQISEGEILDAIRRPLGAKTIKAVKKRVRPGMGRCQGGFCEPRVTEILARELGIDPAQVKYDSDRSDMFFGHTKS